MAKPRLYVVVCDSALVQPTAREINKHGAVTESRAYGNPLAPLPLPLGTFLCSLTLYRRAGGGRRTHSVACFASRRLP